MVEVVNAEMLRALRVVSVERGHDPRDFALVAFGGAGPLHACALAEELGIATVLVPAAAACSRRSGWSRATSGATASARTSCPLAEAGELPGEGEADLRYRGQSFELTVPLGPAISRRAFHRAHEERYGYADRERAIELVAVRDGRGRGPGRALELAGGRAAATSRGPARASSSTARRAGSRRVGGG